MLSYFFGIIFFVIFLYISFMLFVNYLQHGGNQFLKKFTNCNYFEYEFKEFKGKSERLFNRQALDLIFDDHSKVLVFSGIEDPTIIPMASLITGVDEDTVRAGSKHQKIELNQFVKEFSTQSIENVKIYDKNNKLVEYYISKGVRFEGNKQHITISLKNEIWNNIKKINFSSTTNIDATLFYNYYAY